MNEVNVAGIGFTSKRTRSRLIQRLRDQGIRNTRVLEVMEETPRHIFLDEALAHRAYEDTALPIGYGQTLSQPYIVARMTEILLEAGPISSVLELGTGSGYQTAILSQLVESVYSLERIRPLQDRARQRLRLLRMKNIYLKHADGFQGWPERAPFAGIMVTAAPRDVPEELLQQLADGGRMILPVGPDYDQHLVLITRTGSGFVRRRLEPVRFVPLLDGIIR